MRNPFIVTLLPLLLTVPVLGQQSTKTEDKPSQDRFVVGDPDHSFDFDSAKGLYLAVYLLPTISSPESRTLIHEYTHSAPTLAGVRQIFVSTQAPEAFQAALGDLPSGDKEPVYRDTESHIASHLSVTGPLTAPVLVILDPSRHEIFRFAGKTPSESLPFATFAKRIADATQDKESREANIASHLAIEGYDPVAYLEDHKAVPGDKKLESSFKGIVYRFASSASRDKFNAEPTRYLPAYGGWCATAMAKGEKVEIDPKNFKVTNGRVFLFYKSVFANAVNDWNKDEAALTVKADANWKKVVMEN